VEALDPPVSRQRAHRIVQKALAELAEQCHEKTETLKQLELNRLNMVLKSLFTKRADPRYALAIVKISERIAKLNGLDAPQKIETTGAGGGPIQVEHAPNYDNLSLQEKLQLEALLKKTSVEGMTP
jgi:hypothetical protein